MWLGKKNSISIFSNAFIFKNYKAYGLRLVKNDETVLDVGCSSGEILYFLQQSKKTKCIGVDFDQEAIKIAKSRYPQIDFYVGDAQKLSMVQDKSIETLVCFDVLEHLKDPKSAVAEFGRVLKPQGKLILQYETSFRFDKKSQEADLKNYTKNSWIQGEDVEPEIKKFFEIKESFYGGQLLAGYNSSQVIAWLYRLPLFMQFYSIVEMILAKIVGKKIRGTWEYIYAIRKLQ